MSGTLGGYTLTYKRIDPDFTREDDATVIVTDTSAVGGGLKIWDIHAEIPLIGYVVYITRTGTADGSATFYFYTMRQEYIRP